MDSYCGQPGCFRRRVSGSTPIRRGAFEGRCSNCQRWCAGDRWGGSQRCFGCGGRNGLRLGLWSLVSLSFCAASSARGNRNAGRSSYGISAGYAAASLAFPCAEPSDLRALRRCNRDERRRKERFSCHCPACCKAGKNCHGGSA